MEAGGTMAEVGLLPFARIALQISKAVLPRYRSRFSKHQFTQPQLLAILCLMRYEDWTFCEAGVRLGDIANCVRRSDSPACPISLRCIVSCSGCTSNPSTKRSARPYVGCAALAERPATTPWAWTRRAWHRERSARSLCVACTITARNPCPGGIG